jgi:hypothetical protein
LCARVVRRILSQLTCLNSSFAETGLKEYFTSFTSFHSSSPPELDHWVKAFEFDAGILGGETPVNRSAACVARHRPSRDFTL